MFVFQEVKSYLFLTFGSDFRVISLRIIARRFYICFLLLPSAPSHHIPGHNYT